MKHRFAAAALIAATLAAPALAARDSETSRKTLHELVTLMDYGKDVGEVRYFEMKTGDVITLPLMADATTEYYVNATCDEDCLNLDLVALDADGTEADTDDFPDNGPVLNFQASEYKSILDAPKKIPRPMTIEIRMIDCQAEVCLAALRIEQIV